MKIWSQLTYRHLAGACGWTRCMHGHEEVPSHPRLAAQPRVKSCKVKNQMFGEHLFDWHVEHACDNFVKPTASFLPKKPRYSYGVACCEAEALQERIQTRAEKASQECFQIGKGAQLQDTQKGNPPCARCDVPWIKRTTIYPHCLIKFGSLFLHSGVFTIPTKLQWTRGAIFFIWGCISYIWPVCPLCWRAFVNWWPKTWQPPQLLLGHKIKMKSQIRWKNKPSGIK